MLVSLSSLHAEVPFGRGVLGHIAATSRRHVEAGEGPDDVASLLGDTALPHIGEAALLYVSFGGLFSPSRRACGFQTIACLVCVLRSGDGDGASLLGHVISFLKGGMAIRQRHALVIASLRLLLSGLQRGMWPIPSSAQLVPILVGSSIMRTYLNPREVQRSRCPTSPKLTICPVHALLVRVRSRWAYCLRALASPQTKMTSSKSACA